MTGTARWTEVSTVGDLLARSADLHPDRDMLVFPGLRATYAAVFEGARNVARGLLALGVRPGDHVALLAPNGVEYVEAFFGISLLGAVVVPLNARHRADELGHVIANGDAVALLTTASEGQYSDLAGALRAGLPSLAGADDPTRLTLDEAPRLRTAVLIAGEHSDGFLPRSRFDELVETVDPAEIDRLRARVRVRDTAAIMYTSGTTANPKGCVLSHEAMTRGPVERARYRLGTGEHDVTWSPGPLFHIGTLAPFLGVIGSAGTFVTDVHFEPSRALALLAGEKATVAFPWFPALLQPLLDHPDFDSEALAALRSIFLIGPGVLLERVQALLPGCELVAACGMTEAAGIYAISDPDDDVELRARAQGKACPGMEIRIIDVETGDDVGAGVIGEILVRGYSVMEGYYRSPEKTAESIDADRWLHTGDLYSFTPEGQVAFHGRLKDMLKVGGENVAAVEIEAFIARHPAIEWVEVVGRPDPRLDEVPVAFVEIKTGHTVTEAEILDFCAGRIARYKVPHEIHFLAADEWPRSATKINKNGLRERLGTTGPQQLTNAGGAARPQG
ncbi:class I adenylate-forming enzyme family protein [Pseudonocardia endophytica]|uniref:Fatty-acyl-CoA synthase/long-chain acyl-CoA synthetase n=1 Tax=Pseudonocardia endophytica TaxID=401976 RepID=A0A4R1HGT6_PSEEN|nr:AMP-binding protein [Pseudonocardia endophytica]TCK21404.1 fatty-acyl-CoA synthase/long-chain acyl-CoA synthetase [Pseudonocardia endophytica]